eukprot:3030906-Pyramimonas_sp.AAC.1
MQIYPHSPPSPSAPVAPLLPTLRIKLLPDSALNASPQVPRSMVVRLLWAAQCLPVRMPWQMHI